MPRKRWALLDAIDHEIKAPQDITDNVMAAIAGQLEDAITAPNRESIDTLKGELADLLRRLVQAAPSDAVDAALGRPGALDATLAAVALGQVGFAQALAAHVAHRRADEQFVDALRSQAFKAIFMALLSGERTGQSLADITGERPETISRKLKGLRELGLIDARRDGTSLYNFLTPAARGALGGDAPQPEPKPTAVDQMKDWERGKLDKYLQDPQTFGPKDGFTNRAFNA